MADNDSFVAEVTEEVRRDQMYAVWRKYGPWVIFALAAIILGTAGGAWWSQRQVDAAREASGPIFEAAVVEDDARRATLLTEAAAASDGDLSAIARLRAGAALAASGDVDGAAAAYQAVADDAGVDRRLRELGGLRVVMVRADAMPPDEMLDRLRPLAAEGAPWRPLAMELTAAAHLRAGDREAALATLADVAGDATATPGARQRSTDLIAALGGEALGPDAEATPAPDDAAPEPEQEGTDG